MQHVESIPVGGARFEVLRLEVCEVPAFFVEFRNQKLVNDVFLENLHQLRDSRRNLPEATQNLLDPERLEAELLRQLREFQLGLLNKAFLVFIASQRVHDDFLDGLILLF